MTSNFFIFYKKKAFQSYEKWFLFPRKSSFRSWDIEYFSTFFISFPQFPDSKGQTKNFSKHQRETVIYFQVFFVFHDLVHKWGLGAKEKIKLNFSWSLLKYLIFKSFLHVLAVLGYLPKLRRVMRLVFSADFLHTFSKKMFLAK